MRVGALVHRVRSTQHSPRHAGDARIFLNEFQTPPLFERVWVMPLNTDDGCVLLETICTNLQDFLVVYYSGCAFQYSEESGVLARLRVHDFLTEIIGRNSPYS